MKYIHPKKTPFTKGTIEKIAEKIAEELEFESGSDLFEFVGRLGGKVRVVDFWDTNQEHGAMTAKAPGDFVINIPDHTSPRRDNFTIAHELGHYFLHFLRIFDQFESGDVFHAKRFGSDRVEWEANWFASAFLMPEQQFRGKFEDFSGDLYELSDSFKVSLNAAEIRLKRFGLLE